MKYRITTYKGYYTARYMTGGKPRRDKKTGKTEDASQLVGCYETLEAAVSGCRNDAIKRVVVERGMTLDEALKCMMLIDAGVGKFDAGVFKQ